MLSIHYWYWRVNPGTIYRTNWLYKTIRFCKKVNAFVGINILRYQSGQRAIRERIGRHGNTKIRVLLYEMIQSMLFNKNRIQNHIVDYYYKLTTVPMNKPHMVAVVGAENHLIRCMYNLVNFKIHKI